MGSAKNRVTARKARIEEMRRAEQARERRNRILTITASVVVVAGLVAGGAFLHQLAVRRQGQRGGRLEVDVGEVRHGQGRREDMEAAS